MSYRFQSNMLKVDADTKRNISLAVRYTLDDIQKTSKEKTPKRLGDLRKNVVKKVFGTKGSIVWQQKYAAYQEAGARKDGTHRVSNYTTPGTGPHFADDAVKEVMTERVKIHLRTAGVIE